MTVDFGADIYCDPVTEDADEFMSEVTGVPLVRQDLRHRLMTDSVLGKDETGALTKASADAGYDLRKLVGATRADAEAQKSRILRTVLKDSRITSATVDITETDLKNGLSSLTIAINCQTALGPFRLVFLLDPTQPTSGQVALIVNQ